MITLFQLLAEHEIFPRASGQYENFFLVLQAMQHQFLRQHQMQEVGNGTIHIQGLKMEKALTDFPQMSVKQTTIVQLLRKELLHEHGLA